MTDMDYRIAISLFLCFIIIIKIIKIIIQVCFFRLKAAKLQNIYEDLKLTFDPDDYMDDEEDTPPSKKSLLFCMVNCLVLFIASYFLCFLSGFWWFVCILILLFFISLVGCILVDANRQYADYFLIKILDIAEWDSLKNSNT